MHHDVDIDDIHTEPTPDDTVADERVDGESVADDPDRDREVTDAPAVQRPAVPGRDGSLSRSQQIWALRIILLLVDALFIVANAVYLTVNDPDEPTSVVFTHRAWNGDWDGSHVEVFGHIQLIAGAVLLVFVCFTRRTLMYAAWALTLLTLMADDFFQVHEHVGAVLVTAWTLPGVIGLRPQDLGELIVWAGESIVLGVLLIVTTVLASREDRRASVVLFAFVVVLAVFGVGVDQLHIILEPHLSHPAVIVMTFLETGGELVGMTLLLLTVHAIGLRPSRAAAAGSPALRQRVVDAPE